MNDPYDEHSEEQAHLAASEEPTPGTVALTEATEQLPASEVRAEKVLEKVDGSDRKIVVAEMRVAPVVALPNPFEGVELPDQAIDAPHCPTCTCRETPHP